VDAVANGIAFDEATERIYLTGKRWPRLFEIRVPAGG
jgi:glutaminyl-peptide cyclotransferase